MSYSLYPPILLGLYPLLHFVAENINQLNPSALLVPFSVVVLLLVALVFVTSRNRRNVERRRLLLSGAIFLFFTYGALATSLEETGLSWQTAHSTTMILDALLFVLLLYVVRSIQNIRKITGMIILFGSLLWATPVCEILYFTFTLKSHREESPQFLTGEQPLSYPLLPRGTLPDIFFFVFDRYPNTKLLQSEFSFDNSKFLSALEEKGFMVCKESYSPYPTTTHSLASILNMNYLPELLKNTSASDVSQHPMYQLISRNAAVEPLLQAGYTYTHLGSWWGPTASSPVADENVNVQYLSEVSDTLLRYTPMYPLFGDMIWVEEQHGRIHVQMNALKSIAHRAGPQFVFGHFTIPHEPAVFAANGARKYRFQRASMNFQENFVEQVQFVNSQILNFLDHLADRPSSRPFLVLLQSDEGPFPDRFRDKEQHVWAKATPDEIKHKLSTLSAFLLPKELFPKVPMEICTPVNIFRVLHSSIFNTPAIMLPKRNFMPRISSRPYDLFEVTEMLGGYAD
jgi:hypothetical protein